MPTFFALILASFAIDKPKSWLTMILVGAINWLAAEKLAHQILWPKSWQISRNFFNLT
jgi:hypothetical protein